MVISDATDMMYQLVKILLDGKKSQNAAWEKMILTGTRI